MGSQWATLEQGAESEGGLSESEGRRACSTEGIKMGFCSAVTLAFATIFSLAAVALLAIAFSTDNWLTIHVNRGEVQDDADREALAQKWLGSTDPESVAKISNSPLYFTRTRGLFRECYPGQKSEAPQSPALGLYMSPVETWCRNLDYYIPDEDGTTNNLDAEQMTRIHMNRAMVALFIVGFFFMFIACLFSAGGMGLWHGVEHWERNKINTESDTELFVKSWNPNLFEDTEFKYEWSYIVSWVGVGLALISSILFSLAAVCIRTDKERE